MKPANIFYYDELTTIKALEKRFNIPSYILSVRAQRCKKRKMYNGVNCAVFTKKNLEKPKFRQTKKTKRFLLKLSENDIDIFCKIAEKTDNLNEKEKELMAYFKRTIKPKINALKAWDALVRQRHD